MTTSSTPLYALYSRSPNAVVHRTYPRVTEQALCGFTPERVWFEIGPYSFVGYRLCLRCARRVVRMEGGG